jgi:hypothetical protein
VLAHAEFAYSNSVNESTGKSPFYIVNRRLPRGVTNFARLLEASKMSVDAKPFANHMKEVHEQVQQQLQWSNQGYKQNDDVKR